MFRHDNGQQGAPTPAEARDMVRIGMTKLRNGDDIQARTWFERARRSDDPEILLQLGVAYQQMDDLLDAERCLSKAATAGNQEALDNLIKLGTLLEDLGRLTAAKRVNHQALASGEFGALHNLGIIAAAEGDDEEAARLWRRAAAAGIPNSMMSLGRLLSQKGHQTEARLWCEQAADDTANDPSFDRLRAALYQLMKHLAAQPETAPADPIAAARDLREAGMAWHLDSLRTRDPHTQERAIRALLAAADLLPDDHTLMPAIRGDLADVLLNAALDDEARDKFDRAAKEMATALLAVPPDTPAHVLHLARLAPILASRFETCYGDMSELDEVEKLFRYTLDGVPNLVDGVPAHDTRRAMLESHLARVAKLRHGIQEHRWPGEGVSTRHGAGGISVVRRPSGGTRWVVEPHADVSGFGRERLANYRSQGDLTYLTMGVEVADAALADTYPRSDRRRYQVLVIRGLLLLAIHEHSGEESSVAAALHSARESRAHISESDLGLLDLLSEWANSLQAAHSRHADPALLSEAAHVLGHISDINVMRHRLSDDPRHLDDAISASRDALALSATSHADVGVRKSQGRSAFFYSLGQRWAPRSHQIPESMRDDAEHAFSLGLVLMRRGSPSDLKEAESHLRAARTGLPHDDRRHAEIPRHIAMARQMRK